MARRKKRTRRIGRRSDNDKGRDRREEGRRRRWTARKKGYGYGGGWRQGRETMPKAREASRPEDEHELHDRRGRLKRAGPTRAESCEQRNVSREPRDVSRETGEERHRSAGAKSPQRKL